VLAADGPSGTDLRVETTSAGGARRGQLIVRINRILQPAGSAAMGGEVGQPCLSATWRRPEIRRYHRVVTGEKYLLRPYSD
jgi:hypothetical protein